MKIKCSIIIFSLLIMLSCSSQKQSPAFYDPDNTAPDSNPGVQLLSPSQQTNNSDNSIIVPFEETDGIKHVKASVNGRHLDVIFNTECSGSLISVAEANYLYQNGYLKNEDIMGTPSQTVAGAIVENMVLNLKEFIIDGKINCNDVNVTVAANMDAPLLLCKDAIDRVASYTIDNEKKEIDFELK